MECIDHFTAIFHFSSTSKHQKTRGFLMFSGSTEMGYWLEIVNVNVNVKVNEIVFCEAIFFDIEGNQNKHKKSLTIGERTLCNHLYQTPKYEERSSIISKTYSRTNINLQAL